MFELNASTFLLEMAREYNVIQLFCPVLLQYSDKKHVTLQRSKLNFSKSHLLATFNCKMATIKKFWSPKKKLISTGGHFVYVARRSTMPSDTFATLFFAELLCLLAYELKDNCLPYFSRTKVCDPALL